MYKNYTKEWRTPHGYIKKILLVMKITTIFLFAVFMQVSAAGLAQRLTLVQKDASLRQVFLEINKQTSYNVIWSADQVNVDQKINANFKDTPLLEVLDKCLANSKLTYSVENKTIAIKEKTPSFLDKVKEVFAQVTVTGKVQDETGQPLVGVTVKQKGTNNATATDLKGAYSLTVTDNTSIISFSYIGYEPQELAAKDIPNASVITLKAVAQNLHEVLVNKGYYTERQELSTGSTARLTSKEIEEQPVTDPIMALEGRIPGLYITQFSGIPGSNEIVRIRGQNSIANGNDPLYIVDGVPFASTSLSSTNFGTAVGAPGGTNIGQGMGPFNSLNPSDIENIEVLKDADATAIYGSRGANGVILITTKKGKAGKTSFDANFFTGAGQVTRMMPMMNTQQYLQMRHEALKNDGISVIPSNNYDINGIWDTTRYTNWQKAMIGGTAQFTNAQATISGGNTNTQFLLSGNYSKQTTVYPGDYADQKGSVYFNLNHISNDQKFNALFSVNYVNDYSTLPQSDFTSNIKLAPDAPPIYKPDGSLNWQLVSGVVTFNNPLANIFNKSTAVTNNLISNLVLSYNLLPGLQIKSSLGFNHIQMDQSSQTTSLSLNPINATNPSLRRNGFATTSSQNWIIEPQVNYQRNIGHGKLDVLVGTTFQNNILNSLSQFASGFSNDALIPNIAAASNISILGSNYTQYRYNAIYGRINYNLQDKYIINLTARRDGSSRFGPGNQFGNFGAVGGAWIFSKEKFIANNFPFLSFGKLRASYGVTGNDQLTDYQYLSTYSINSNPYQGITGLAPTSLPNNNFGWEVDKKLEGGVDLGFLNDRVIFNISYYRNRTDNQLVGYPLPSITGFSVVQANLPAALQNTGTEFSLNTSIFKTKNFSWNSSVNLSIPRNKLIAYPNLSSSPYKLKYVLGQPLSVAFTLHNTGVNPQTGLYTYQDINNDGLVNTLDYQPVKTVTQNYYGGFQNSFTFKRIQLDILFQFVNQTGYNYLNLYNQVGIANQNVPTYFLSRWQQPGDNTSIQKFSTTQVASAYDAAITDASFIRLKNLALSYQLPSNWQQKSHLKNARIYIQGQNLFTITNYQGLDPETQGLSLPPIRMITVGIQASL